MLSSEVLMTGEAVFIQYFFPATNKRKFCGVLHEEWELTDSNTQHQLWLQQNFMVFQRPILALKNVSWGLEPAGTKLICVPVAGAVTSCVLAFVLFCCLCH